MTILTLKIAAWITVALWVAAAIYAMYVTRELDKILDDMKNALDEEFKQDPSEKVCRTCGREGTGARECALCVQNVLDDGGLSDPSHWIPKEG